MSLGSIIKGWVGEVQGTIAKKILLDSQIYVDINNVTIPTPNGTTQIDHVIVSRYGVFVVETKNMDGWIFGSEKSPQWTQSIFGKKYKFQNPLHQNYRRVARMQLVMKINELFHPVHIRLFGANAIVQKADFFPATNPAAELT
jgi:restriction system protein